MAQNNSSLLTFLQTLTLREKVLMVNMALYFLVGGTILYRGFFRHAAWPAYLIGSAFLLMGSYRFYLFYKALTKTAGGGEVAGK